MLVCFEISIMLIVLQSACCIRKSTIVDVQYGLYACWPKSDIGFSGDPTFSSFLLNSYENAIAITRATKT
jgi:hypothetical protein